MLKIYFLDNYCKEHILFYYIFQQLKKSQEIKTKSYETCNPLLCNR